MMPEPGTETYTTEEIEHATALRQNTVPSSRQRRRDRCPHTPPCPNTTVCIEDICWYLRHRRELEA